MSSSCRVNFLYDKETPIIYRVKRYVFFALFTAFSLVMPWITIGGNHIFLLSFDKMQLHLFGVAFDMQEFYLMPFLVMFLFLFIFFITVLGGRVWCGWACPQTIFRVIYRDLVQGFLLGLRRTNNKQKEPKGKFIKRSIGVGIWIVLSFIAASNLMWFFIPPEDFFTYIMEPAKHPVLIGFVSIFAGFLIYDVIKLKEDFCGYVCPYVRIQSALYDHDTVYTIYDEERGGKIFDKDKKLWKKPPKGEGECIGCEACVTVCPTHIDIRKGMQFECINCLECADACTDVMKRLGKRSLITWDSNRSYFERQPTRFFRFKIIGYLTIMSIVLISLFAMGSTKENMLLNINRSSSLYVIKKGFVKNDYIFLFTNTQSKKHKFYFEVDHPDIAIERPKRAFNVLPGGKVKKVVVLRTKKKIGKNKKTYTKIPIKITAFAVDNKKEIVIFRNTNFIYPPLDEVK